MFHEIFLIFFSSTHRDGRVIFTSTLNLSTMFGGKHDFLERTLIHFLFRARGMTAVTSGCGVGVNGLNLDPFGEASQVGS